MDQTEQFFNFRIVDNAALFNRTLKHDQPSQKWNMDMNLYGFGKTQHELTCLQWFQERIKNECNGITIKFDHVILPEKKCENSHIRLVNKKTRQFLCI